MIHQIEGSLTVAWNDEVKAIIDTWQNYSISLDDFKDAVLVKGLNHAKANNGCAWIVDSSKAKGAFSDEIQNFIAADLFPAFAKNKIKYFITVTSKVSAITRMTVSTYAVQTGPAGIKLIDVDSVDDAIQWLKEN